VEELDFLRSPYLRLLFAPVLLVPAWDWISITHALGRFHLGLLLSNSA
jgi:hypothetical protein